MATITHTSIDAAAGSNRFFLRAAAVMTVTIVAGFSLQYLMGRSTFASPFRVHAHAVAFMGWVAIYLLQNIFVATGRMDFHRRLGWVAAVWIVPMIVLGIVVTIAMVRLAHVPFFFRPLQFLVFDPMTVLTFAGLTSAAIILRRKTEWHRRLHFCGMSMLMGPAFGRLLPMPLLKPWAFEATVLACLSFPIIGAWVDARRSGNLHPAWGWGVATMMGAFLLTEAMTYSPVGTKLYYLVTAGSPGADVPPLGFPAPPSGALLTGR